MLADDVPQPLRFQGQYYDEESGLSYNCYRYYDDCALRYLSPDPLAWVDPLGLAKACPERTVNGTKIYGKGQKDGTPGHDQFSEVIANKLAMSGRFKEIYLNRSYDKAMGSDISKRRPDIIAIDENGRVHSIELASKTDMGSKFPDLTARNETVMNNLPLDTQGSIIVLRHPFSASDIKLVLDNLISDVR